MIRIDLKPHNVLLDANDCVKLSDFGVSKVLHHPDECAKTLLGTPLYMSPELLCDQSYSTKNDIWALGCMLFELMTLSTPFEAKSVGALVMQIINDKPRPLPTQYSAQLRDLALSLLDKEPKNRPTINAILSSSTLTMYMYQFMSVVTPQQARASHEDGASTSTEHFASNQQPVYFTQTQLQPKAKSNSSLSPLHALAEERTRAAEDITIQLFLENQAAAKRNKARVEAERETHAVFLDFYASQRLPQKASEHAPLKQLTGEEAHIGHGPLTRQSSENVALHTSASYERQLEEERQRVRLERKLLQERMRALAQDDSRGSAMIFM